MKITSGEYEILHSGTIISFGSEPVIFQIQPDMKVKFKFDQDSNNTENRIEFKIISNDELEITLLNFDHSLGAGNTEPLKIGTLKDRALYLNFRIYTLNGNKNRTIHYSWYLEGSSK